MVWRPSERRAAAGWPLAAAAAAAAVHGRRFFRWMRLRCEPAGAGRPARFDVVLRFLGPLCPPVLPFVREQNSTEHTAYSGRGGTTNKLAL